MTIGQFAAEARTLGLDAIDLSILLLQDRRPAEVTALRREIESAGLFVNMVTGYPDFTHPEASERKRQVALAKEAIDASGAIGARFVRLTAGQAHHGVTRERGIAWAAEGLLESASYALAHGIQPVFENHARPGVWRLFDFCYPTDFFLALVKATEGSGLGINFDTANTLAYGDDPVPVLRSVRPRLACIHAAETRTRGRFEPVVLGTGSVPFREIFRFLRQSGFDGPMSIEEASRTGPEGLRRAVEFVRRVWDEEGTR